MAAHDARWRLLPLDLYIFTKRYATLHDAIGLQMANRLRELLFTMFALMAFSFGCAIYLHYT